MLSGAENIDANADEEMMLGEVWRMCGARCDSSRAWGRDSWLGGWRSDGVIMEMIACTDEEWDGVNYQYSSVVAWR